MAGPTTWVLAQDRPGPKQWDWECGGDGSGQSRTWWAVGSKCPLPPRLHAVKNDPNSGQSAAWPQHRSLSSGSSVSA